MSSRQTQYSPEWARARVGRVCAALRVPFDEFVGRGRQPATVECRDICSFVLHECEGPNGIRNCSYPETCHAMHRSNHSTVIDMANKVSRAMALKDTERTGDQQWLVDRTLAVMDLLGLRVVVGKVD